MLAKWLKDPMFWVFVIISILFCVNTFFLAKYVITSVSGFKYGAGTGKAVLVLALTMFVIFIGKNFTGLDISRWKEALWQTRTLWVMLTLFSIGAVYFGWGPARAWFTKATAEIAQTHLLVLLGIALAILAVYLSQERVSEDGLTKAFWNLAKSCTVIAVLFLIYTHRSEIGVKWTETTRNFWGVSENKYPLRIPRQDRFSWIYVVERGNVHENHDASPEKRRWWRFAKIEEWSANKIAVNIFNEDGILVQKMVWDKNQNRHLGIFYGTRVKVSGYWTIRGANTPMDNDVIPCQLKDTESKFWIDFELRKIK